MILGYTYRIVPIQGGRLMIRRDDGMAVLGDRDFPSEDVAVAALAESARSHGLVVVTHWRATGQIDFLELEPLDA